MSRGGPERLIQCLLLLLGVGLGGATLGLRSWLLEVFFWSLVFLLIYSFIYETMNEGCFEDGSYQKILVGAFWLLSNPNSWRRQLACEIRKQPDALGSSIF